jgi:hypothetical protein
MIGGNGEIRTHGAFRHDSFQDCCNKPDSATFPNLIEFCRRNSEKAVLNSFILRVYQPRCIDLWFRTDQLFFDMMLDYSVSWFVF